MTMETKSVFRLAVFVVLAVSAAITSTTTASVLESPNRFQRQASSRAVAAGSHADPQRRVQADDSSDPFSSDGGDSVDGPDNNGATPTPTPVAGGGGGIDESSDDGTPSPIDSGDGASDDVGDDTFDSPDDDTLDSPGDDTVDSPGDDTFDSPGDDGYGDDQGGDSEDVTGTPVPAPTADDTDVSDDVTPTPSPAGGQDDNTAPSPTTPSTPEDVDDDSPGTGSDDTIGGTEISNGAPAAMTDMASNNMYLVALAGGLALLQVVL